MGGKLNNLRDLSDNNKISNTCTIIVPEEEEKRGMLKDYLKK